MSARENGPVRIGLTLEEAAAASGLTMRYREGPYCLGLRPTDRRRESVRGAMSSHAPRRRIQEMSTQLDLEPAARRIADLVVAVPDDVRILGLTGRDPAWAPH